MVTHISPTINQLPQAEQAPSASSTQAAATSSPTDSQKQMFAATAELFFSLKVLGLDTPTRLP